MILLANSILRQSLVLELVVMQVTVVLVSMGL